ncbi:MAG: hypothetical protein JRD71_06555 [Deltaproteobacteria bacterium]|nr:hypothetical protein [Deltaproteobacteria bacterium]
MVENLNIQKVLSPTLTSRIKKEGREKNKNRQRSFEEELRKKKEKKEGLSVDKQKADEKTNIKKEGSLKEKNAENTESMESKPGKLIDLHI